MNIDFLVQDFTLFWHHADENLPQLGDTFSVEEKRKREEGLLQFSKSMKNDIDLKSFNPAKRKQLENKAQHTFGTFFQNSFNFSSSETAIISNMGFSGVTKRFMTMARRFDPEVKMDDVFQACRNLWIVNSLQIMLNEPVKLTPSIFAYSMLYPYSDNLLDNPHISTQQKLEFSKRFRFRLEGQEVIPANENEKIIFDLVALIENDWDRVKYPKVFESLLSIHDAQTKSIFLSKNEEMLSYNDLLTICIEKGGTSVLADGYLINGDLTEEQERFCFGFGTFLQFVDDIQDIHEDIENNIETLFTHASYSGQLDIFTNKAISFTQDILSDLSCFPFQNSSEMKSLMNKSINFLLTEAVGLNHHYFSQKYVSKIENYSPFGFEFVRRKRSNMDANRISLMKKIESFVFDEAKIAVQV